MSKFPREFKNAVEVIDLPTLCMVTLGLLIKFLSPDPPSVNYHCYTTQLKYVFWLEENVSRAISQNYLTP